MALDTSNFSTPVKAGATGVLCGGLAIIGYQFRHDRMVLVILVLGVIGVALLLLAYKWLLGQGDRARSKKISKELKEGGPRTPREINSPQALAKVADLKDKFDEGVEKFRAAGKNLYSLPWYLLVGEPGAGKTEAVRHCNVGFPAGLQEMQQGVGGTVNMNWWFTNYAVILDTAGRMLFDGVEAGSTAEWREFLKLLHRARPQCPVNGLILVIPADSLIVNTADAIDVKAGRIAQQLDVIQRTLGVRFPAFVIVTKSDRINGFREFFDSMDDPRLQHQMLGWSNPDPLDAPFDPERVDEHLRTVERRLNRRRMGLLLDPVHTEDPMGRRLDQVDALFALPESLAAVAPRLRRYLERIFAVGEWSPKPLFLRGIYFTSSMREGSALDKDLADLLGVPVESLPEGKVWVQDRAFFLRDLFINKMFREKGLVTRSNNTRGVQTRRKAAVLGTGFLAVLVLATMTVLGRKDLEASIGNQADYWDSLNGSYRHEPPPGASNNLALISTVSTPNGPAYQYRGGQAVPFGGDRQPLRQVLADAKAKVDESVRLPVAFKWRSTIGKPIEASDREAAYGQVFATAVLQPLLAGVRQKMSAPGPLDAESAARMADALQVLLRLEGARAAAASDKAQPPPSFEFDTLFRFILSDDKQYAESKADGDLLRATYARLYKAGKVAVPAGTADTGRPIKDGVAQLTAYWGQQFGDPVPPRRVTARLHHSLLAFRQADADLQAGFAAAQPPKWDEEPFKRLAWNDLWTAKLAVIESSWSQANAAMDEVDRQPKLQARRGSLVELYQEDQRTAARAVLEQLKAVRDACPPKPADDGPLADAIQMLADEDKTVAQVDATAPLDGKLQDELTRLDDAYFKPAGPGQAPRYQQVHDAYHAVAAQVEAAQHGAPAPADALARLAAVAAQVPKARADASACLAQLALPADAAGERRACAAAIDLLCVTPRVHQLVDDALKANLADGAAVAALVQSKVPAGVAVDPPPLPMTVAPASDPGFQPDTAGSLLAGWAAVRAAVPTNPDARPATFAGQDRAVQAYVAAYAKHWDDVLSATGTVRQVKWSELHDALPPDDAAGALRTIDQAVRGALGGVDAKALALPPETADLVTATLAKAAAAPVAPADAEAVAAVRRNWVDLSAKPAAAARDTLVSAGPTAVAKDYLEIFSPPAGAYGVYWHQVTRAALTALAGEAESLVVAREKALSKSLGRFPFAPPSDQPDMTAAELAAAGTQLDDLVHLSQANAADFAGIPASASWYPDVYNTLRSGRHGDPAATAGGADAAALKRADDIYHLLVDLPSDQYDVTVTLVDRTTQQAKAGGRQALADPATTLAFSEMNGPNWEDRGSGLQAFPDLPPGKLSSGRVYYRLGNTAAIKVVSEHGGGSKLFKGPYPCLRALYEADARRSDGGKEWFVPMAVGADRAVVFVRFSLVNPVPKLR